MNCRLTRFRTLATLVIALFSVSYHFSIARASCAKILATPHFLAEQGVRIRSDFERNLRKILGPVLVTQKDRLTLLGSGGSGHVVRIETETGALFTYKIFKMGFIDTARKNRKENQEELDAMRAAYARKNDWDQFQIAKLTPLKSKGSYAIAEVSTVVGKSLDRLLEDPNLCRDLWEKLLDLYALRRENWFRRMSERGFEQVGDKNPDLFEGVWSVKHPASGVTVLVQPSAVIVDPYTLSMTIVDSS